MAMNNQWAGILKLERPVVNKNMVVHVTSRCGTVNRTEPLDRCFRKIFEKDRIVYVKAHINPHGLLMMDSRALTGQDW